MSTREEFAKAQENMLDRVAATLEHDVEDALTHPVSDFTTAIEPALRREFLRLFVVADQRKRTREKMALFPSPRAAFNAFWKTLESTLAKTVPDGTQAQVRRIAGWLATATTNGATLSAGEKGSRKEWVSCRDDRVRDTHVAADGQKVLWEDPFTVCGVEVAYPGEPVGPIECWISCRCVAMFADEEVTVAASAVELADNPFPPAKGKAEPECADEDRLPDGSCPPAEEKMGLEEFSEFLCEECGGEWADGECVPGEGMSEEEFGIISRLLKKVVSVVGKRPSRVVKLPPRLLTPGYPGGTPRLRRPQRVAGETEEFAEEEFAEAICEDCGGTWVDGDCVPPEGLSEQEMGLWGNVVKNILRKVMKKPKSTTGPYVGPRIQGGKPYTGPNLGRPYPPKGRGGRSAAADTDDFAEDEPSDEEMTDGLDGLSPSPMQWFGVLLIEGVETGDGRKFTPESVSWRDLPLPLSWQKTSADGHTGSVVVGKITDIRREGPQILGDGEFVDTTEADEVIGLLAEGALRGVSVDVDMAELAVEDAELGKVTFDRGRISGATLVAIPAFSQAIIELGVRPELGGQVSDEGLLADGFDVADGRVAADAQQATYAPGDVIVVYVQRGPGSTSSSVSPPRLGDFFTDRASASLLLRHGIELGLADPVLTAEGAVSTPHPAFIREVDTYLTGPRPCGDAVPAIGAAPTVPLVEVRVGTLDLADTTGDGTFIVDGHTADLPSRGRRTTPVEVVVPLAESTGPDGASAIGNRTYLHVADLTRLRQYDAETRRKMMEKGQAMRPGGEFPIADEEDLKNAIHAIGRASDPDAAKAHIKKRASALGKEALIPDGWTASTEEFGGPRGAGDKRGPGWVTHPQATRKIHSYWTTPGQPGYAKIGWGSPGDWQRCRNQLAKYVGPRFLNRTCSEWHFDALGYWPATHAAKVKGKHGAETEVLSEVCGCSVSLTASAEVVLDHRLFANPDLDGPTALRVEGDHVFGHLALFGTCHIGMAGVCVTPPRSSRDYAYFRTGSVLTDVGDIPVGQITLGTGHADLDLNAAGTKQHYDHSGAAVADVACGEDAYGIWVSGSLRSGVTEEQVRVLRASPLSGDWRKIGRDLELVAALCVNTPGFPVPRTGLAASGGHQTALVASGIVERPVEFSVDAVVDAVMSRVDARARNRALIGDLCRRVNHERVEALTFQLGR